MPIKYRVQIEGMREVKGALSRLRSPGVNKAFSRFLLKAGYAVLKDAAENQIIRGGRFRSRTGSLLNTPPHPSRLTSRTGELRRSLGVGRGFDRSGLPRYVEVGSDLSYARTHELGLGRYPKRAFLEPAVEAVSPQFEGMLLTEIEKGLRK